MTKKIDGQIFYKMLNGGAASLSREKSEINDLNVFPIPDGDTGDNMLMTLEGGLNSTPAAPIGETAQNASKGMLLGARGNSGVILSRIFSGIAKGLTGLNDCGVCDFNNALKLGAKEAYEAVATPVEGTILTVFREGVDFAGARITSDSNFESVFEDLLSEFNRSLEHTPELLPVLKESGVVDSGGAGLICIYKGMYDALTGAEISPTASAASNNRNIDLGLFTEDSELEYGYCTEFLLRLQRSKTNIDSFNLEGFINQLNSFGDSVVAFIDGTIVKVHIHTKTPGEILSFCQQFGEFLTLKIENMTLQHNETEHNKHRLRKKEALKPFGIVAVASGKGIKETFIALGCDAVVEGGQSMNPSTEDIIQALNNVNAENVFLYPNNGNVIMAAEQATEILKDTNVFVVPTKTVGEGYAAISMLDTSGKNPEQIVCEQKEIISEVVTGVISQAVRDTEKDGIAVKTNDYIGFIGDTILVDDGSRDDALMLLSEKLNAGRYDIMLVIYGESISEAEAEEVKKRLRLKYRRAEIVMIYGGQPIYDYILVLE